MSLSIPLTTLSATTLSANWVSYLYSSAAESSPILLGNDKSADQGGFRSFVPSNSGLVETSHQLTGRTKLVSSIPSPVSRNYSVIATITSPDSTLLFYDDSLNAITTTGNTVALGDWSALCGWRSKSSNAYLYLFGKKQAQQYLVRSANASSSLEVIRVQNFTIPYEASGCTEVDGTMYISNDESADIHAFSLTETTGQPALSVALTAKDSVTGLTSYHLINGPTKSTSNNTSAILLVGQEDSLAAYALPSTTLLGSASFTGLEDPETKGLAVDQSTGTLAVAYKADDDAMTGFATADISSFLTNLSIPLNPSWSPSVAAAATCRTHNPITSACSSRGFYWASLGGCSCFAGSTGDDCSGVSCTDSCSGNGECVTPDVCSCATGWGGLYCSSAEIPALYETDIAGGEDGDDPAVWLAKDDASKSRIITTFKSEVGAGFGVFDLHGKLVQKFEAPEPNNVDVIYGFEAGNRTVDLVFAGCREKKTLCLYEITSNGTLASLPGSSQPVPSKFKPYGSCTYRSAITNKQYLFVNSKDAKYLQYELTSTPNGTLTTTLVRTFTGGSGGQTEGCVSDEQNAWLIVGEEPYGLWRYGAEPADGSEALGLIASLDDASGGRLHADVEGVTLVVGPTNDTGLILVSTQGVSAYNVYQRYPPHAYVGTFSIADSGDGGVDRVTNTDGLTVLGTKLGDEYPYGIMVTHDDANQNRDGTTNKDATFKIIGLKDIFGGEQFGAKRLLDSIDTKYNPRA